MARYPPHHKAATRERLVETARRVFREGGFEGTSIHQLMHAADLTRGGFYAHFDSKEALVREILALEPGLLRKLRDAPDRAAITGLFEAYLDPKTRDDLIYCPLVAHPLDALRGGGERRALYAKQVSSMIDEVAARLPDEDGEERATLVAVLAIGAAILSSAMDDPARADRIENAARDAIRGHLDTSAKS